MKPEVRATTMRANDGPRFCKFDTRLLSWLHHHHKDCVGGWLRCIDLQDSLPVKNAGHDGPTVYLPGQELLVRPCKLLALQHLMFDQCILLSDIYT